MLKTVKKYRDQIHDCLVERHEGVLGNSKCSLFHFFVFFCHGALLFTVDWCCVCVYTAEFLDVIYTIDNEQASRMARLRNYQSQPQLTNPEGLRNS